MKPFTQNSVVRCDGKTTIQYLCFTLEEIKDCRVYINCFSVSSIEDDKEIRIYGSTAIEGVMFNVTCSIPSEFYAFFLNILNDPEQIEWMNEGMFQMRGAVETANGLIPCFTYK